MISCQSNWKEFIGVLLCLTVVTIGSEGRPQQQYRRPYNTFNITLVPYPTPQYQYYNPQYQFHQNTRSSRNISNFNSHQPVIDPTVPHHDVNRRVTYTQPVIDTTVPQPSPVANFNGHQQPTFHQQKQNGANDNNMRGDRFGHQPTFHQQNGANDNNMSGDSFGYHQQNVAKEGNNSGNARTENLHRDARNSTKIVTHLPASGPVPVAKEKTRILTHHVNPSRGSLSEDLRGSTQDIIFPDSFENLFDPITKLDVMPQCAQGGLYCEDIPTYPYHQIRDTLRRTSVNNDLFFDDEIDSSKEIANRISGPEEKFICKSIERTIYPKVGMTKNNKWKYIINQNQEGYIQGVRVETCLYPDRACDLSEHMPLGVVTSCKQKYVTRRMMSLADDGVPLPDIFLMPSACCCSYRTENPLLRARNVDTTPATP